MLITDTYILINLTMINSFRNIKEFKLDLGHSLTNEQNRFLPNDINVQKHYMFFNKIITKCGNIGKLHIYSNFKIPQNTIEIYNEKDKFIYELDGNISLYENINNGLDEFFTEHNLNIENKPETKIEETKQEEKAIYTKPDKPLSEMTIKEKIAYSRNLK